MSDIAVGLVGRGDDRRRLGDPLPENVSLEHIRQPHLGLVRDVLTGRDGEDLCDVSAALRGKSNGSRSISSSVNCLVSRTKKKIKDQAIRLRPA